MESVIAALSAVALLLAALAFWRTLVLSRGLSQLKRDQYYVDNRLKRVPEEITGAVEPLRRQVANLVEGKPVSAELVRCGGSYVEMRAADAQPILAGRDTSPGRIALIDVRTAKEFAAKRIPGARLVPFEDLDKRYQDEIPLDADRVFVYCASGERSRLACDFLGRRGYTNIYNIQDGLRGWAGATEGEGEVTFIKLESRR